MNEFNPGAGWREIDGDSPSQPGREVLVLRPYGALSANENRYWVRVAPVLPLPTEPYTVIRAEGEAFEAVMILQPSGTWTTTSGNRIELRPADHRITGFEVLAEPRAATAKAVLDRIQSLPSTPLNETMHGVIAREFGVAS